jgi:hypothetical protein
MICAVRLARRPAEAAGSIVVNGGTIRGTKAPNSSAGLAVVPVPANATPLPLGSTSPGSLNINTASDSITLAPGNYVVANLNVRGQEVLAGSAREEGGKRPLESYRNPSYEQKSRRADPFGEPPHLPDPPGILRRVEGMAPEDGVVAARTREGGIGAGDPTVVLGVGHELR